MVVSFYKAKQKNMCVSGYMLLKIRVLFFCNNFVA